MKIIKHNNLEYIQFDNINKTNIVRHFFSTRKGGVSENEFYSMNLSFTRGDKKENVIENFEIIENETNIKYRNIVMCKQTHTNNIHIVTNDDIGKGVVKHNDINDVDALITNIKNIPIAVFSADCVPIYFVDIVKNVIGIVHSGWRGTANLISKKTIEAMTKNFGTNPKDIVCAIGPSIGKCCFQIDDIVIEKFSKNFDNIHKFICNDNEKGKYKMDLWALNSYIIENCGVHKENIEVANLCTMCNTNLFYSHRAMGNNRGSMIAVIELI